MREDKRSPIPYRSLASIVCGLLGTSSLVVWGQTHWEIFRMLREGSQPSALYALVATFARPSSLVFAVVALVLYATALVRGEPLVLRCLALALALPGLMALFIIM